MTISLIRIFWTQLIKLRNIYLILIKILYMISFIKFFDMELRVYKNLNDWSARNSVLAVRIDHPDGLLFPYDSAVCTFKAIYGDSCVIDFVIL